MRTVTVTAEDIEAGERGDMCACPVARAIRRDLGWPLVVVGGYSVFSVSGRREPTRLPDEVTEFIQAFDAGRPVSPFSFTLRG